MDAALIKADVDRKKRVPGDAPIAGRRLRKHPMRFGGTSLLWMSHTVKSRAMVTETAMDRMATVEARLPSKFH